MDIDAIRARWAEADARDKLEKQLRAARFRVSPEYRGRFERARFDYAGRRLIGDGCELVATGPRQFTPRELKP